MDVPARRRLQQPTATAALCPLAARRAARLVRARAPARAADRSLVRSFVGRARRGDDDGGKVRARVRARSGHALLAARAPPQHARRAGPGGCSPRAADECAPVTVGAAAAAAAAEANDEVCRTTHRCFIAHEDAS
eukprot:scaffold2024_cov193-Prasinococcus_capsulatus_cf.AAC.1